MVAPKLTTQGFAPDSTVSGKLSDKNRIAMPRDDVLIRCVSHPTGWLATAVTRSKTGPRKCGSNTSSALV